MEFAEYIHNFNFNNIMIVINYGLHRLEKETET